MAYTFGTEEWENAYGDLVKKRLAESKKPYIMGTPEWVATYEKLIQEDENYKEVAKTWEGSVVIHILANPAKGLDDDIYMYMDLWHGNCRYVKLVPRATGESADFVLTGEMERWEAVMKRELDTTKAMMQGKIKLKGSLPKIVRYVKASLRLTELSAQIDTRFHADMDEEERADYTSWFNALRTTFGF
ncbi:MAG TPA: SCP2 sterol-binding domain-containing protein [Candidatus Limnocylindrales bacterium]|nr:SCP2 sterol-binding domain-containing protein [Candidatus Limnocylindrales bacterium]